MAADPVPWEIMDEGGHKVASNGLQQVVVVGGTLVRQRAIKGIQARSAGDVMLPKLNELAGELVKRMDMPAEELRAQLVALAGLVPVSTIERVEWVRAELGDVKVYSDGITVVVTRDKLPAA